MKKSILSLCILIFFFACKKNDSNTPASTGTLVTSIRSSDYTQQQLSIDSFVYDDHKNIIRIIVWDIDTLQVPVISDSTVLKFTYTGSGANPSSYLKNYYYGSTSGTPIISDTENHTLTYDNQGRVIFDTTSDNGGRARRFKYTSSYIAVNQVPYKDTYDTLFLNNGNVTAYSAYSDQYGIDFANVYTPAGTQNPFYNVNSAIGAAIGPLVFIEAYVDFISKNSPATSKDDFNGINLEYSYTTNSAGLPLKVLAKDRGTGIVVGSLVYNYQ